MKVITEPHRAQEIRYHVSIITYESFVNFTSSVYKIYFRSSLSQQGSVSNRVCKSYLSLYNNVDNHNTLPVTHI
jgi:hypothetical protein